MHIFPRFSKSPQLTKQEDELATAIMLDKSGQHINAKNELKRLADINHNPDTMYYLGLMFKQGRPPAIPKDIDESVKYLNLAAQAKHTAAAFTLGEMYYEGQEIGQDLVKAKQYYEIAMTGNPVALFKLGEICFDESQWVEAASYYQQAIELGNNQALPKLVATCLKEPAVFQHNSTALQYCCQAADGGDIKANWLLGTIYREGEVVAKNIPIAIEYFLRITLSQPESTFHPTRLPALLTLGDIYRIGEGDLQNSLLAEKYYLMAAKLGSNEGYLKIGDMYYSGEGVSKNVETAMFYYYKAAANNPKAWVRLGKIHLTETDGRQDVKTAIGYYQKAAANGNACALMLLGDAYRKGNYGLPVDISEAIKYYPSAGMEDPNGLVMIG